MTAGCCQCLPRASVPPTCNPVWIRRGSGDIIWICNRLRRLLPMQCIYSSRPLACKKKTISKMKVKWIYSRHVTICLPSVRLNMDVLLGLSVVTRLTKVGDPTTWSGSMLYTNKVACTGRSCDTESGPTASAVVCINMISCGSEEMLSALI